MDRANHVASSPSASGTHDRLTRQAKGRETRAVERWMNPAPTVEIVFLIYSLKCYTNTVSKGREGMEKKKDKKKNSAGAVGKADRA